MLKTTKDEFPHLIKKIDKISQEIGDIGEQWVRGRVDDFEGTYREHLKTQGRGGQPPPLSQLTREIYSKIGEPDGSGIRNHIRTEIQRIKSSTTGIFGILEGRPTIVAKVQDQGAVVPVTLKMRRFLAAHGIYIRGDKTHFVIPARYSWTNTHRDVLRRGKQKLKNIRKL